MIFYEKLKKLGNYIINHNADIWLDVENYKRTDNHTARLHRTRKFLFESLDGEFE